VPDPTPGRALVTRRALKEVVRTATLGSYGVTGMAASLPERLLARVGLGEPGIRISFTNELMVELDLTVAHGLPIAEVARQVDSAVRYAVRRAAGRDVDRLTIHVDGLRWQPGAGLEPPSSDAARSAATGVASDAAGPEPDVATGADTPASASRAR
jgi:uncharacterized alkaline shock family protein YloU